ncbi:AraC family transcriptional regulator [Proteiniborus sp. MB09-C3]|uniref:helix-turn-helix domain-containing protein n=1 Tax=Proteiniborus sp. MB09-C3 TaxID=3050072 RepID=UPI0025555AF4|nr:AraC family transcriptional regulator [Proteiniborus sp. MB09-C3]WIV13403.1 AraC family transcriptional regulator [Proteiniborus sp. MB09-C3]
MRKKDMNKKIYSFHVKRAMDYTKNNYKTSLNLSNISKYLGLNKCYFCNLFKKETGKTYSQFLNEIRIEKSKDLLANTNLSILEIALSVGYNNQNYYNMSFKKITGLTPLKYRNISC